MIFEDEDEVGVEAAAGAEAEEEGTVDEEAVARFWGAPRFGTPGVHEAVVPEDGGAYSDDDTKDSYDTYDAEAEAKQEHLFGTDPETVTIPESTYSLLFLFNVCSAPFAYAVVIAIITIMCLVMALIDALDAGTAYNVLGAPGNVTWTVKMAQYLGILICLIMEEEIPTALQLLRVIPQASFEAKFPYKENCYNFFFASCILRIAVGLMFLVNAYLILVQSTSVLEIFFDVLALQFVSTIDDIAFKLAKMDIMGSNLRHACSARLYQDKFLKHCFRRSTLENITIRSTYLFELLLFVGGMTLVTVFQNTGQYQCQEITVDFGDGIWTTPVVLIDGAYTPGYTLVSSYFNGVYKIMNRDTFAGRPVYTEMKKQGNAEFDESLPHELLEGALSSVVPAQIKYSPDTGSWILTHPHIRQQMGVDYDSETWLLRSPQTDDYELQTVDSDWDMWTGRIESASVKISCNTCFDNSDCNLNGVCGRVEMGKCDCDKSGDSTYLGVDCKIKLENKCETMATEDNSFVYGVNYIDDYAPQANFPDGTLFQAYSRPIYFQLHPPNPPDNYQWLGYTGSRWFQRTISFTVNASVINEEAVTQETVSQSTNFHAFWSNAYSAQTKYISDPSTKDTPVGVDFYIKGETNNATTNQFGPFGALTSTQKDGQTGRGVWRCAGTLAQFHDPIFWKVEGDDDGMGDYLFPPP